MGMISRQLLAKVSGLETYFGGGNAFDAEVFDENVWRLENQSSRGFGKGAGIN